MEQQLKIIEAMNYAVVNLHMQGFARLFSTDKFTPNESDHEWVKQKGMDIIKQGFDEVDGMISGQVTYYETDRNFFDTNSGSTRLITKKIMRYLYNDYGWHYSLTQQGSKFAGRMKSNAVFEVIETRLAKGLGFWLMK